MDTNVVPQMDTTDNPTGCCPRFHPEGWDRRTLHFEDKPFVRVRTWSMMYFPLNLRAVFGKTQVAIEEAHAEGEGYFVLSHDDSPWRAEHLFAVTRDVPDMDMVRLSGDFLTRVFEGPFRDAGQWADEMKREIEAAGKDLDKLYFFYPTCPGCAKTYGENYVVGVARVHGCGDRSGGA